MRHLTRFVVVVVFVLGLGLAATSCATAKVPPPGDPLRPPAQKLQAVVSQDHVTVVSGPLEQAQDDCDAMSPDQGPPPKPVSGKDSKEAERIASEGLHNLIAAEKQDKPYSEVTVLIEQSVGQFHQSLALDPQNVKATYNLSAAYARIGRNQCAVNLVARLVAMNKLGERKKDVGDAFDRIWGSGTGRWKGKPDPDFEHLRTDKRLTDLVPQPK
jgi:hypothetical protein